MRKVLCLLLITMFIAPPSFAYEFSGKEIASPTEKGNKDGVSNPADTKSAAAALEARRAALGEGQKKEKDLINDIILPAKDESLKTYYESGKLKQEVACKNGVPNGLFRTYYESGQLLEKGFIKDDKIDGPTKQYYESGRLKSESACKNGELDGPYKAYDESGRLKEEGFYKNGKVNERTKLYYESGQLLEEVFCRNGKQDGSTKQYYKSGKLKSEGAYKNDNLEGKVKIYRESGPVSYIDTYNDGVKINRKSYDKQGKLEFDQDYRASKGS